MDSMNPILSKAEYWASSPVFNQETRQEIAQLLEKKDTKELVDRFYCDLEFGTGGLRGLLGAGTSRMNLYNVRRASKAVAQYVKKFFQGTAALKIAISYDSRNFSREFAIASAEVFAHFGIKVFITKNMRPVPMLSYMVRYYECNAGICITASHNPSSYNGYKVYWQSGGQLVPPHDKEILDEYAKVSYENLEYLPSKEAEKKNLIQWVEEDLDNSYFNKILDLSLNSVWKDRLKIVYSSIHGSGIHSVPEALKRSGFRDVVIVGEQAKPDGNFPTVSSPNPEDPKAMIMALDLGKKVNADIVLATDPDADRLGIIVREGADWISFNGNQLGVLLTDYILKMQKEKNILPQNALIMKTVVTTELQKHVAEEYGASSEDTLTGFKWIGERVEEYESGKLKPYKKFICGGEESYGFVCGSFVRDKDATISAVMVCEMLAYYQSKGKSLTQVLDGIFLKHGVYWETLTTLTLTGKDGNDKIKKMMEAFRSNPPKDLIGLKLSSKKDYKLQTWNELENNTWVSKSFSTFTKSDVLQFSFANERLKVSVRPSGTEPKIKFYFSLQEPVSNPSSLPEAKANVQQLLAKCEEELVRLAQNV